ncbi:MAG: peptidase M3 [Bdellovibrionales bacterium RIFOXYB1_FULL_37_110]|nr:MAG: peptidase M3 [Bdellovibrionales bacterium RIFOXYA1_FULL_38_20]OFZ50527.1 MAG: peptidase M3 [Bdellovibrionales bacterium RIFOXYC1_FULL_37_79]OFZ60797.1 MAG: peptidase M3 [Bdellovibrionales bacterium RIFOXYB1_FULL_37_110]OFZ64512.1 MAG: peptidase M3 [Bdellovibrionales bacterium RIFOXYD1_FULL_36_51]
MNPFLSHFETVHGVVPFDKIKNEHFMEGLEGQIAKRKSVIEQIKNNPSPANFENVIGEMDKSEKLLEPVISTFSNLFHAEASEEMQKIAKDFFPRVTSHENDITLDEGLFHKVKTVYQIKDDLNLNKEQLRLLEIVYKSFVRNGANLNAADKDKFRSISSELSKLGVEFSEHVLNETNNFELHITNEKDLKGLPDSSKEAARMVAKDRNKEGWIFTLQMPSLIPFLQYAENRELRKKLYTAHASRGIHGNKDDNCEVVKRIVELRHQKANLLGYKTHADFVLEERMAQNFNRVNDFLNELLECAMPVAKKEMKELTEYAKTSGGPNILEAWDSGFYAEKLKLEKFNIDDEILRPFFKLEDVVKGVFEVAGKLYSIKFNKVDNIPVYHEDVTTYEVTDEDGSLIGIFYADFFPRKGKKSGAWMTSFKSQSVVDGKDERPHISIVCNFTKPTESKPSLITFNEVKTLFHEFGHALHGLLSKCTYHLISGTNVYWDFVELPSQIMENWAYEKECLDLFARHYETGEKIPLEHIRKIKDSSNFHEGRNTLRQLSFGMLDMGWHANAPGSQVEVEKFEKNIMNKTRLFPEVPGTCMSTAFNHIFSGGYSAGYYSYKWAEVLDADAFEYFLENGIFNKNISMKFRKEILSKGGSEHPAILYKNFRGRDPEIKALLKRAGLA